MKEPGRDVPRLLWQACLVAIIFVAGMMTGGVRQELKLEQKQQQHAVHVQPHTQLAAVAGTTAASALTAASPATTAAGGATATVTNLTIMASDLSSLSRLNALIERGSLDVAGCDPKEMGAGWGNHHLCTRTPPAKPCHFYSFGVSQDFTFDVAVAEAWGCRGFAADPTVVHNSTLHPLVTFHNIGANSPWAAASAADKWLLTTVPALRHWLKHDRISVLKMDCEGCEYSLAADVLAEEPGFFSRVAQFAVEVHWSRMWMKGVEEMHALASLLDLLDEAGLKLKHVNLTPCGAFAARTGLLPELEPHMRVLFAGGPQRQCHNYLFSRV